MPAINATGGEAQTTRQLTTSVKATILAGDDRGTGDDIFITASIVRLLPACH
jgi:hypothetical protein